ncbi:MAG TPA: TetR/AcrR family transcriptional regulator [Ktedonosporobacter sp.]|nr:TetR/AcrR family transcriptional regulator [Ktedonosporobacter sp.]
MTKPLPDKSKGSGKTRLIQAAKILAQENSFDEITIDEIVKRAALSRPAFYYHFAGGKEELRAELVRSGFVRERPSQDARQAILEAALHIFARVGTTAATLDEITNEAGVSRGTLSWHFRSKDELLTAVIHYCTPFTALRTAIELLDQELQNTAPLDDEKTLHRIAGGFYDAFTVQGDLIRLSIVLAHTHPEAAHLLAQKAAKGRQKIIEYIKRRQEEGIFRQEIDAALVVQMLSMPFVMHGIGHSIADLSPFAHLSREETIHQLVSTLLYGIIPRHPHPKGDKTDV